MKLSFKNPIVTHAGAFGAGLLIAVGTGFVFTEKNQKLEGELAALETQRQEDIRKLGEHILSIETLLGERNQTIADLTGDRDTLAENLKEEQERVAEIEDEVGDALKTVGILDKLSKTDAELLMKYSKVYFLNEHYAPPKVAEIKKAYVYDESRTHYLHAQVMPFFDEMVEAALEDGVMLYASSAYRSFSQQSALKSAYSVTYGSGANTFSADQGYSEHQLGTTVDFTTTGINGGLDGFDTTPAYTWLLENAHRYGFVLSYPKNNAYYIFEPWHWRFVGVKLATQLHKDGKFFYDEDQREIDKYLVSIFD